MEVERPSVMSDQLVIVQYFTFIFNFLNNSFTGLNSWRLVKTGSACAKQYLDQLSHVIYP